MASLNRFDEAAEQEKREHGPNEENPIDHKDNLSREKAEQDHIAEVNVSKQKTEQEMKELEEGR